MTQIIQLGQPPLDISIRRSARAKRISLRVSGLDGRVSLTLPHRASEREAHAFLREKEGWIRDHLGTRPEAQIVGVGMRLPIDGIECEVVEGGGRRVHLGPGCLTVPKGRERAAARIRAFVKLRARDRLLAASTHYAEGLGRSFRKITLRDTRSRWGSCTSQRNLMYSWRLVLAPPHVLDYVAAHEVAHLAEMNHSPRFWAAVEDLMPDYREPRKWLKSHGASLHRYQF